ncbi:MAG: hypothetical protein AAF292_11055 [Pseudomonadota bacterium]
MQSAGAAGSNDKKTIHLSQAQTEHMMKVYKHFSEAVRPPEMLKSNTELSDTPFTDFMPVFFGWLRQTPRYHPLFNERAGHVVDIDYIGFDYRMEAMTSPDILGKASKFAWHHRAKVPQPELMKAWLDDKVDLDGTPKPGVSLDVPKPVFKDFTSWNRYQQFMLDQKRDGKTYIEQAETLLSQHKAGWDLPAQVIDNCERFLTTVEHQPSMKDTLAVDYVDFALPSKAGEVARPEINLKKSIQRKKISKKQLACLEDVVVYLLPPALRIGLTRKLSERQLHFLVRAAKWLRHADDPVWKKPWTDGLDLLALMVMDRDQPLSVDMIRQVAEFIQAHIDEPPDHARLMSETSDADLTEELPSAQAQPPKKAADAPPDSDVLRRLILNPDIKHFPGSDTPKDLILSRMGILTPGSKTGIDMDRLDKWIAISDETYARRDDPSFWLMSHLENSIMLMNDIIDLDGNFIAEDIEVTPFLRKELKDGPGRKLWDKVAGVWLYPGQQKGAPEVLTKWEAETLQLVCYWLSSVPRSPRPFFWFIQDMTWGQLNGDKPIVGDRMRQLAQYIHDHRNEPPDFEKLKKI